MLRTIEEWNHDAGEGIVREPLYSEKKANTGIACPQRIVGGRMCAQELWDTPFFTKDDPPKRKVFCGTCGWRGARVIAHAYVEHTLPSDRFKMPRTYRIRNSEIYSSLSIPVVISLIVFFWNYDRNNEERWRKAVDDVRSYCERAIQELRSERNGK